jgi:hypothetical protein
MERWSDGAKKRQRRALSDNRETAMCKDYPRPEYRLQAEVVQGLQPRSHAPFSQRKKGFAGLKALIDFRLKPALRRDCDPHAKQWQLQTRAESPAYHLAENLLGLTISRPYRASLFLPRYPGRCPGLVCLAPSGLSSTLSRFVGNFVAFVESDSSREGAENVNRDKRQNRGKD